MTASMTVSDRDQTLTDLIANQRPGHPLDSRFYRVPEIFARDLEKIFMQSWLWVGHASQIREPGDFFLFEIADESVIVVRGSEGEIHALVNVCRHRGSRVCIEQSGSAKSFVCPYHGWTYDINGNLRSRRWMPEDFDETQYGLKRIRSLTFHGLIFVSFAAAPPPLDDALRALDPCLRPYELARTKVAHRELFPVNANWKLTIENFMECYHCAVAHREYSRAHSLKVPESQVTELREQMLARSDEVGLGRESVNCGGLAAGVFYNRHALYPGYVTGSEDGQALAPLLGEIKGYDGGAADVQIGPVNFLLLYSDHAVVYRFTPRTAQRTDMEVVWLVHEDAKASVDYDLERLTWLWRVTTEADEEIIRLNQEGVNSRFFEPGPLSEMEQYTAEFIEWYLHMIRPPGRAHA